MVVTEISIIHHVGIVLVLLWLLNSFNCCHPIVYFVSLVYLIQVHERYTMRLRKKLQFEGRKAANQKRVLTDSETVRWLNHAVEKIWPICMEQIISQKIFLAIIPWFLKKYKPWTVKKISVDRLYLGRSPPLFTEMRVLRESTDDDHLVLELGLNFLTADDMSAILSAKLRQRLGFGLVTKLHLTGMHVEGKVLVGVKFIRSWPFLGRLRVCFAEPPYFQMTVKPLFSHGLDVTEVPGIAGWLDNLLAIAFEETLVQPNMLVVDVEKFISPQPESGVSVDVKETVAYTIVEVIEAAEMKPSDMNGLADPYVKGQVGLYTFKTQVQKKTLTPKWQEEFKIPICSWDVQNVLEIEVRDKDLFGEDYLGKCSVNINDLRDGQRRDMWLPLENIKMGRLHLAITVVEANGKGKEENGREVKIEEEKPNSLPSETTKQGSISTTKKSRKVADKFEPIDVEGQKETGIWVHHPGSEVSQAWEPRKGKERHIDTEILSVDTPKSSLQNDSTSDDESQEGHTKKRGNFFQRGMNKMFHNHKHSKKDDHSNSFKDPLPSPHTNVKANHDKRVGVNLLVDESLGDPEMKDGVKNKLGNARDLEVPIGSDSSDDDDDDDSVGFSGGIPISSSFILRDPVGETKPKEDGLKNVGDREVPIEESLNPKKVDGEER